MHLVTTKAAAPCGTWLTHGRTADGLRNHAQPQPRTRGNQPGRRRNRYQQYCSLLPTLVFFRAFLVLKQSVTGKYSSIPLPILFAVHGAPPQRLPRVVTPSFSIPVPAEPVSVLWRFLQTLGHEY